MKKRLIHTVLTSIVLFAVMLTVGAKASFFETETPQKTEVNTDNEQEIVADSFEATFPVLNFKLSAYLVFVFEIFSDIQEIILPTTEGSPTFISSYWIKLFTSYIVVNAP